ncbi:hypothetical protein IscW_ISCW022095, partial [Ixodes scapularis]
AQDAGKAKHRVGRTRIPCVGQDGRLVRVLPRPPETAPDLRESSRRHLEQKTTTLVSLPCETGSIFRARSLPSAGRALYRPLHHVIHVNAGGDDVRAFCSRRQRTLLSPSMNWIFIIFRRDQERLVP